MLYLKQAIANPSASSLFSTVVTTADQYDELIAKITKKYDKKQVIHQHHVLVLVNHPRHRQGNHKDLVAALETYEQHIDSMENTKLYDIGSFLTSLFTSQMTKDISDKWNLCSKDHPGIPDITELLAYLHDYTDATGGSSAAPAKTAFSRQPKAAVHAIQSAQPRDRPASCSACGGELHVLYTCNMFKAMLLDAKQEHVR